MKFNHFYSNLLLFSQGLGNGPRNLNTLSRETCTQEYRVSIYVTSFSSISYWSKSEYWPQKPAQFILSNVTDYSTIFIMWPTQVSRELNSSTCYWFPSLRFHKIPKARCKDTFLYFHPPISLKYIIYKKWNLLMVMKCLTPTPLFAWRH